MNGSLTPSNKVFLFNRVPNVLPKYGKTVGGGYRGVACIALSFSNVDDDEGEEDAIAMLQEDEISGEDFKKLTGVTPLTETDQPSTLVVQFNVWEQGKIDAAAMKERLSTFVSHALWDVVTELQILPRQLALKPSNESDSSEVSQLSTLFSNFLARFVFLDSLLR